MGAEIKNGNVNRVLLTTLITVVMAFGGLCITGFFYLARAQEDSTMRSYKNIERIAKIEECILGIKEKIWTIDTNVKELIRTNKN